MKSRIYLLLLLSAVIISCNKKDIPAKDGLTVADFKTYLTPGMDYPSIVVQFGQPSKDIGSGLHIYVYILADATQVWIGYANKIYYARHMDSNDQLIEILI